MYDDLGSADTFRPALGGFTVDGEVKLPYPRHLANLKLEGTFPFGKPWVPLGETGAETESDVLHATQPLFPPGTERCQQCTLLTSACSYTTRPPGLWLQC